MVGAKISHYRILAEIGSGGMGSVYCAEDLTLGRQVALKVVSERLIQDPTALERFRREARTTAALAHPNICAIFEVGEHEGQPFLVMEMLDGQSLHARVSRKAASVQEIVEWGIQVADALCEAHSRGIIHRDLKPANLFLTNRGQIKILDFGISKIAELQHKHSQIAVALGTEFETLPGVVLGTPQYMSPEQVRGDSVDTRSDLFSFGVVLYELATGRVPFEGKTAGVIFAAILGETPISPIRLNPNLPVQFESILNKALEKDASLRYQHASELLVDLQRLKRDLSSELIPANTRRLPPFWPTARFMQPFVGLLGVCILGFYILRPTPEPHITATRQVTHEGRIVGWSAADGNRLYFSTPVSSYGLQLRETSVKGGDSVEMRSPIRNPMLFDISSDRSVLLVGDASILTSNSQPLWILPILGGSPRRVGNAMAQSASFSPDGEQIVYAKLVELHITRKDGTEIRTLPVPTNHPSSIKWVRWSPDGRLIRFDVVIDNHDETWEVQPDGAALRRFLPEWKSSLDISGGIWTPDAKYFLFLGNQNGISNAYAMRELNHTWPYFRRGPTQLTNGPFRIDWLSTSVDGKRIFVGGAVERRYLARLRAGGAQDSYLGGIDATWAEFSKNGKHVAYASSDFSNLWRCESDGSNRLQLTYDPFRAWLPRWSPDDKMLAFIGVDNSQISRIYVMPSEGGTAKPITHGESEDHNDMDPSWTPDGKSIVFSSDGMDTNNVRLRGVDLANGRVSALPGSYNLWSPRVSPDGSTIAALSGIDQALVLYDIRSHTQSILSSPGVGWPVWSRDGKWIYFNDGKAEQIRRIRLRDRRIETVADPKQAQILITGWIGLTPEGELLATRESKVEDIYALDWNAP